MADAGEAAVRELGRGALWSAAGELLARYRLELVAVPAGDEIPGSHWGDREAGLVGSRLYARADTPVHSLLHEASHFVCMDGERRRRLDTDAGGDDPEEAAVCYLSLLLAEQLAGYGAATMLADMDAWGYSFRLGSSRAWFETDAEDAAAWLLERELVDRDLRPTFRRREAI